MRAAQCRHALERRLGSGRRWSPRRPAQPPPERMIGLLEPHGRRARALCASCERSDTSPVTQEVRRPCQRVGCSARAVNDTYLRRFASGNGSRPGHPPPVDADRQRGPALMQASHWWNVTLPVGASLTRDACQSKPTTSRSRSTSSVITSGLAPPSRARASGCTTAFRSQTSTSCSSACSRASACVAGIRAEPSGCR